MMSESVLFLEFVHVFRSHSGDNGVLVPNSDVKDMKNGAKYIPAEVTDARREGKEVEFHQPVSHNPRTWYWRFSDGTRISYALR